MLYCKRLAPHALIVALAILATGCTHLETFTLRPTEQASILRNAHEQFGICWPPLLAGPVVAAQVWWARPDGTAVAGHEVLVTRGESCHSRVLGDMQTALAFDLSALPTALIESAELELTVQRSLPEPPIFLGSTEQCSGIVLGRATEPWPDGFHPDVTEGHPTRPFVADRIASRRVEAEDDFLRFDVQRQVIDWRTDTLPNFGFTLSSDPEHLRTVANPVVHDASDSSVPPGTASFICPVYVHRAQLEVVVRVRD